MKSPRWPRSAWRSYGSSSGGKPRAAVHGSGIDIIELAKMVYEAKKDEVGSGGGAV